MFEAEGFEVFCDADVDALADNELAVVVNTCGFIKDAKEESINTILELAQAKDEGRIGRLYVMGCLSERYRKDLEPEITHVDKYFGKFDWVDLLKEMKSDAKPDMLARHLTTPNHYAYLKISEGCNIFAGCICIFDGVLYDCILSAG